MTHFLHRAGLRARLLLLIIITSIPVFALSAYSTISQRNEAAAVAERDAMHLARLASREQRRLIESTRQLLIGLSKLPELKKHNNASDCHKILVEVLQPNPHYRLFGLALPNGNVFCRTLDINLKNNIVDRGYFQRTMATRDFGIGDYQIGRATGKNSVNFGQAILDNNGNVSAIVFAALNLDWLNQLIADHKLPPGSTLTVVDSRGTVLAHHPDADKWVGQSVQDSSIFKFISNHPGEGTTEANSMDGIPHLYAYAVLHDSPNGRVYVIVGIPKSVAFAAANEGFVRNIALLLMVAMLASIAAWVGSDAFVLRRVKALAAAARKLGSGNLTVRAGLPHGDDELGQLAETFDGMADALQQMNEELEDRVTLRTRQLEEAHHAEQLRVLIDPATDLPNRLLFNDRLSQALLKCNGSLAVALFGIEDIDDHDDSIGQLFEDAIVKTIGARLRAAVPADMTLAHISGNEFALLTTAVSPT